jgi:hypothetical protein
MKSEFQIKWKYAGAVLPCEPHPHSFSFCCSYLEIGVSWTVFPGWPWIAILLISASQVARIIAWATSAWRGFSSYGEEHFDNFHYLSYLPESDFTLFPLSFPPLSLFLARFLGNSNKCWLVSLNCGEFQKYIPDIPKTIFVSW